MPLDAPSPHKRSSSSSQKDPHGVDTETRKITTAPCSETEVRRASRGEQESETRLGCHHKGSSQTGRAADKRKSRESVSEVHREEHMETEEQDSLTGAFCEEATKEDAGGGRRGRGEKSKARLVRPGFVWEVGARLEAKDFMNKWYSAKIVGIDDSDGTVRIHFDGWNQRYDEWVEMDSDRLRPLTRHSDRKRSQGTKMLYKVGESVYARWTDCRMYAAKIVSVNANDSYEVMFDDGVKKTIKAINIDVKPPLSSIGAGRRPSDSSGKRRHSLTSEKDSNAIGVKRRSDDGQGRTVSADNEEMMVINLNPNDKQTASTEQTEDSIESTAVKRVKRLIHVKNLNGRSKKLLPSSSVGSGADDEMEHRCPHADCNKLFRNSTLVKYHIKYYHPDDKTLDSATEENSDLVGRKRTSISSESVSDLIEKKTKARSSVGDAGDDGGDLMTAGSFPSSSAGHHESSVSLAVDAAHQPLPKGQELWSQSLGSRFVSRALESRDRRQRMNRRRAKSLRTRRKQRMKIRSEVPLSRKVINCVCRGNAETSPLIQCTVCLCWQHLHCLQGDETKGFQLPNSSYICQLCTSPARVRESARYSFCQDWLKEGRLAEFSEALPGSTELAHGSAGKAKIMKLTHQLVADLHDVRRVIDSVNRCIFVAQDKIEGELSRRHAANISSGSEWIDSSKNVTLEHNGKKEITLDESVKKIEMDDVKLHRIVPETLEKSAADSLDQSTNAALRISTDEDTKLQMANRDQVNAEGKNDGEMQSSVRASSKETEENSALVGISSWKLTIQESVKNESDSTDEETAKCVNGKHLHNLSEDTTDENDYMKNNGLRATMSHGLAPTDGGVMTNSIEGEDRKLKEENETDKDHAALAEMDSANTAKVDDSVDDLQSQLMLYISQMQDNIEDSLDIIEEQVTALESGECNRNSSEDILKDIPRVKKTLNQLMTDLNKVRLISTFNS